MPCNDVKLSVIIVNYESGPLLKNCVQSIVHQTRKTSFEIIIVDNASGDDSLAGTAPLPNVHLIKNPVNVGFAPANNAALALARGEYVVLLNPDTLILDGALDQMAHFLDTHAEYGVVGPKMFDGAGRPVRFHNWTLTALRYLAQPLLLRIGGDIGDSEVDWVCGACLMIRSVTIASIGPLDDHMFGEDMDWCLRARHSGWRTYHLALAHIVHYCGSSAGRPELSPGRVFVTRQSKLYYAEKHLGRYRAACFKGALLLESLVKVFLLTVRGWVTRPPDRRTSGARKGHIRLVRAIVAGTVLDQQPPWWTFRT